MTYLATAATPPQLRHHPQSLLEAPRGGRQRGHAGPVGRHAQRGHADPPGAIRYVEGSSEGARRPPMGRPSGAAGTRACLTL